MSPLSEALGTGWDVWLLWVMILILALTGAAMAVLELALPELPDNPTWTQRARHALWHSI